MASFSAVVLILRRWRTEIGILVLLFALIATTSFLLSAAPRAFNKVTDDAVRYAIATASPVQRDLVLSGTGTVKPLDGTGVAAPRAYGQQREADFPPSIQQLISGRTFGISSVRLAVPNSIVVMTLRYQDGLTDASRLVDGRWPADRGMPLQQVKLGDQNSADDQAPPSVFEIALSTDQAEAIGAHVGDRLEVRLDNTDSLIPRTAFRIKPTQVEVVGLFEPIDPAADAWVGNSLLQPSYKVGMEGIEAIYATGAIAAEAYPQLAAGLLPFHYDWHYQIDPQRLAYDQVATLETDLQRLNLSIVPTDDSFLKDTGSVVSLIGLSVATGLPRILDDVVAQTARSESVLSIAALGLLGLAAGAATMVAVLLVRRRRGSLLLARGRGASTSLLIGAQGLEAILLAGGAALVGYLIAVAAVPARDAPLSAVLALVVAVTCTLLLVAATWPMVRRPLMQLERDDAPVLRVPPRRLVIEATIVAVALLAVALLRQRGLTIGPVEDTASFDPLLAAVPLLTGLAAGIIVMRLYPLPIRGLSRVAAHRRDFVPVAGLRTVSRHPALSNLPLLVLMLTAAFGAFAAVMASSIDRGQVVASYIQTGADYRLEKIGLGGLPPALDPTTVAGVEAVAPGAVDPTAALATSSDRHTTIDLAAVDAAAYEQVVAGTAADQHWPDEFLAQPPVIGVGTPANPIPAILSDLLPPASAGLRPGDTFTVTFAEKPLIFRLVGQQADFPGHGGAATFAVVPLEWLRNAAPQAPLTPTVLWLRASSDAAAQLTDMANNEPEGVRIVSRPAAYGLLHDAPLGSAVAGFFGLAVLLAVAYMAITLVGAVVLSAAGRTRDLAYMRTLGLSRRQAQGLTAVEHAPPILLALIPGVLLGVAMALLVEPGLGLADFVGIAGVPLFVPWATLLLVILVLTAVIGVAIATGAWLAGRTRLASALRIGES